MHINRKYVVFLSIFMLLVFAGLGVLWRTGRAQPDATALSIDPASAEVVVGNQVTVDVLVSDVTDLYGAAIELTFDPSIVQVVGAQVTPGSCPAPDFIVQNTADNIAGTINYDVTSLSPSPPCNGSGVIASITFDKIAAGTSLVHFNSWLIADTNGIPISTSTTDGEVTDPAGPTALLWLDPASSEISIGTSELVDLRLDNITNVYGAEVSLSYDPSFLEVVGGAVTPGTCPAPDFVVTNTAGGGSVDYAVTQLNPTPPCNGGVVATVEFQCLPTTPADTLINVTIASSLISDPDGTPISHDVQDATVLCVETGFLVEGTVSLQGWPTVEPPGWPAGWPIGADGVKVTLFNDTDGVVADQTVVGPDGAFSLNAELDKSHTLSASFPRYLEIAQSGLTSSVQNEVINVGNGKLPAGDLTGDGVINIFDLSIVGGNFTKTAPQPWGP
jgi:hypothetical protein